MFAQSYILLYITVQYQILKSSIQDIYNYMKINPYSDIQQNIRLSKHNNKNLDRVGVSWLNSRGRVIRKSYYKIHIPVHYQARCVLENGIQSRRLHRCYVSRGNGDSTQISIEYNKQNNNTLKLKLSITPHNNQTDIKRLYIYSQYKFKFIFDKSVQHILQLNYNLMGRASIGIVLYHKSKTQHIELIPIDSLQTIHKLNIIDTLIKSKNIKDIIEWTELCDIPIETLLSQFTDYSFRYYIQNNTTLTFKCDPILYYMPTPSSIFKTSIGS